MVQTLKAGEIYTKNRQRSSLILDFLMSKGGVLTAEDGTATKKIHESLPEELRVKTAGGINLHLKNMTEKGWIDREIRGKRCYRIWVTNLPPDLDEQRTYPPAEEKPPAEEPPAPPVEAEVLAPGEVEADVLGARPGRLAARLERQIPDIVDRAVLHSFQKVFQQVGEAFGITQVEQPPPESEAVARLTEKVDVLQQEIDRLQSDLVFAQAQAASARQERNELREQATKNAGPQSPLSPHDLQESWRPLARQAISEGWRIERSGSGHLAWISPLGRKVFSSATSSDSRAARYHRSDLEKFGLTKER